MITRTPALLLIVCLPLLGIGATAWVSRKGMRAPPASGEHEATDQSQPPESEDLDSAVDEIVTSDPFRLDHAAPPLVSTQPSLVIPTPAPSIPARPATPILTALLGGPPWRAVLEGVAGSDVPVVVSGGMRVGPFVVVTVGPIGVQLTAGDTTWNLRLRRL